MVVSAPPNGLWPLSLVELTEESFAPHTKQQHLNKDAGDFLSEYQTRRLISSVNMLKAVSWQGFKFPMYY